MIPQRITSSVIRDFRDDMRKKEKAKATIHKYAREIEQLENFLRGKPITKDAILEYRECLQKRNQVQTVNGKLSAINSFLSFIGLDCLRLKFLRIQRRAFIEENRELTEPEYKQLLEAARNEGNNRLYHLMLTVAGTGIRISELQFITVEAVKKGRAEIRLKGKSRVVLIQKDLGTRLIKYSKEEGIHAGHIFRTKNGNPLDRSNVCHDMKKLCKSTGVNPKKVFPHNFRHLFARTFYAIEKNLAHLADILGHSSIETTRIYVAASAKSYERTLCKMHLIL